MNHPNNDETIIVRTSYAWSAQRRSNLNDLKIPNHDGPDESIDTPPLASGTLTVYFRNLESQLIQHIAEAEAIVGCVAWLTSKAILEALAKKNPVAIVVQKEDFLRPDIGSRGKWAIDLRRRYDALKCSCDRWDMGLWLSTFGDQTMNPVRCVGNHNRDKHPAFPRMHHKFIVFCRPDVETDEEGCKHRYLDPYAVWTGSFNFTENAGRSLENALYITDPAVAKAYFDEWMRIESLSEPLDWESEWVAPEWRIGT